VSKSKKFTSQGKMEIEEEDDYEDEKFQVWTKKET
jgi:hypothetical protein